MPGPDAVPDSPRAVAPESAPVGLFYSYAHEDEALRGELQDHLAILERRGVIRSWHDRAIVPGHDWSRDIDSHMRSADVVLLLISKDFIASDYIMGVELKLAMERQRGGEAKVVPILLRPVDLQPEDAQDMPFVGLLTSQGLPRDLKPVTTWPNRDEAWTNVASGVRATVNEIRARRPQAPVERGLSFERIAHPDTGGPLLDRVVGGFAQHITRATAEKGGGPLDEAQVRSQAWRLIDLADTKRVLWVDDHPENNVSEAAALAKLQIEVVTVRSTEKALARLAADSGIDLVISDWSRSADGPLAGLQLITAMRKEGHRQPVIYYHGTFDRVRRGAVAGSARVAGALGEAVLPAELMPLVISALNG